MTHREFSARGGQKKSQAKRLAAQKNLILARRARTEKLDELLKKNGAK